MITIKTTHLTSIITICNYKDFQHCDTPDGTPIGTSSETGRGHVAEHKQEGKEGKEGKETVDKIFDYWLKVMKKDGKTKRTPKRNKCIEARLKEFSPEDVCRAIKNCSESKFHAEGGHTCLTLICRSTEKLEYFLNMSGRNEY